MSANNTKRRNIANDILYEDNHIIIVNKKSSDIVQGDKTGDTPLSDIVKDYIKVKYNKPGEVFLGVVHRLDRPVSGALIFARTSKALSRLNEMLKEKQIQKIYWAIVKNRPPKDEDHLIHYLSRDQKKNKSFVKEKMHTDAKKAELKYRYINSSSNFHLIEIELLTGRHHQIRAQLAKINCPIKGDIKYGFNRTNEDASIHLHARTIEFIHPVKKEKIKIIAKPPADNLWQYFAKNSD